MDPDGPGADRFENRIPRRMEGTKRSADRTEPGRAGGAAKDLPGAAQPAIHNDFPATARRAAKEPGPPDPRTMSRFRFTLYVVGESARSQQAYANLRRLCDERLGGDAEITVVDVAQDPEAAERDRVLTTPTVVREAPLPARRVTGDLSDPDKVLAGLALHPSWRDPYSGKPQ